MREITLLCSAAATGLSKAAENLGSLSGIKVLDLEEVLKAEVVDWTQHKGSPRTMGTICSQSDRDTVLDYWQSAFRISVARLLESHKRTKPVLACHLTLFSPSRLEFYSPPILRELLTSREVKVTRVIVLIDDIYDMHARLSDPGNLYNPVKALQEHSQHATKLTGGKNPGISDFSEDEMASLGVEITIKNLMRLLHWRRAEMIAAEEMARNLGADLTVLAVKHEMASLTELVLNQDSVPVYLSHKITEPRGFNMERSRAGYSNEWPELTNDVNGIAATMRTQSVILVQPTAIDELRFKSNTQNQDRLDRYSGELADRWPVPNGSIYSAVSPEAPNHTHMIDASILDHDRYRHGLFGLLQHTIYDEIAFRDHLLVSCNAGLLIYRPTAIEPRISGGVEAEVAHWAATTHVPGRPARPAAFIHVASELLGLLRKTSKAQMERALIRQFSDVLESEYGQSEIDEIWDAAVRLPGRLEDVERLLSVHLRRSGPGGLRPRFEAAIDQSLCLLVSSICRVGASAASKAAHFVAESDVESTDSEFLAGVARFFREPTNHEFDVANKNLVEALLRMSGAGSSVDLVRELAGYKVAN